MSNELLSAAARRLKEGGSVPRLTTRELLASFDAQRRGYWVVQEIRRKLQESGLETEPDFESAYIDESVTLQLAKAESEKKPKDKTGAVSAQAPLTVRELGGTPSVYADPTLRLGRLAAANHEPMCIGPDATLQQAATIMLANDYSQLPVVTSPREVKGMISWASIGTRLSVGKPGNLVRELMDNHQEIRADSSIFEAIPIIVEFQYVLVRGNDSKITGIISASDLSLQFQQLAEPFLLLGEIENHIRRIVGDKVSADELASLRDPRDGGRSVTRIADLSFGEYVRLLENEERWRKVNLPIDRATFCNRLDGVRKIRNEVMHFDTDGIAPVDLDQLRHFVRFLQRLLAIGVT